MSVDIHQVYKSSNIAELSPSIIYGLANVNAVRDVFENQTFSLSASSAYVKKTFAIPDDVDANRITTGVTVDRDGSLRHVPTKIMRFNGRCCIEFRCFANSPLFIVSHSLTYADAVNHWAEDALNDMGSRMIIGIVGEHRIYPYESVTRAEFVSIVVRGLGLAPSPNSPLFEDVPISEPYAKEIAAAYACGLINGFKDGTFRPAEIITREQAMVVVSKAMGMTGLRLDATDTDDTLPFEDAIRASAWARSSIAECLQAGIVSGRTLTKLAPRSSITRGEAAAIIQRLLKRSGMI